MARLNLPEIGRNVIVDNPTNNDVLCGTCTEHLSTQWVLTTEGKFGHPTTARVIHKNWDWRYT